MAQEIIVKKGSELTNKELSVITSEMQEKFGEEKELAQKKIMKEQQSTFFLLKHQQKILAFGHLKPEKIIYLKKNYNIFGIRNIISVQKGKGHGTILMKEMVDFINKKKKTGLGFTGSSVAKFYKKQGFKTQANLRKRLFPDYNSFAHWGFFVEGKDEFVTRILQTKYNVIMPRKKW